jgi:hypothetical protein
MHSIEEIPHIPDRDARMAELMVDTYGRDEELSAFEVYFTDALQPPFAATWRDPDESEHAEPVTVLEVADVDDRRGILLKVRRQNGKERRVVAEQVWADDAAGTNATILDDYRDWVNRGGLED